MKAKKPPVLTRDRGHRVFFSIALLIAQESHVIHFNSCLRIRTRPPRPTNLLTASYLDIRQSHVSCTSSHRSACDQGRTPPASFPLVRSFYLLNSASLNFSLNLSQNVFLPPVPITPTRRPRSAPPQWQSPDDAALTPHLSRKLSASHRIGYQSLASARISDIKQHCSSSIPAEIILSAERPGQPVPWF